MNEQLQEIIIQLLRDPQMSVQQFSGLLQSALANGELIERPLPGNRKQNSFLHELAQTLPTRSDLILHAAKQDPQATLNASNIYGRTFAEILAHNEAWDALRELADERVNILVDSPVAATHETAYRTALEKGPLSLVAAFEDLEDHMLANGYEPDLIFRDRRDRIGNTIFHDLAGRTDLSAQDFKTYLDMQADKIVGKDLRELLSSKNHRGQTFFNVVIEQNPQAALEIGRLLANELSPAEFDRLAVFGGDPGTRIQDRDLTVPESTIPVLQIGRKPMPDGEQLMNFLIDQVPATYLHCHATNGQTPLSIMAKNGWVDALGSALEKEIDPNYGIELGVTNPIFEAMSNTSRPDLAQQFLRTMVDTDLDQRWLQEPAYDSGSLAKFAVDVKDPVLLSKSLFLGANPNGHPASDYSPLRAAIEGYESNPKAHQPMIRDLLIHGASLKKLDMDMVSPSERLQHPELAAARDFAYRTSMILEMQDRYGYEFAGAAVDGLTSEIAPRQGPSVALGTLQMVPGVTRALNEKIKNAPDQMAGFRALAEVTVAHGPDTKVMDMTNLSRALLAVPENNRQQMVYEMEKLRADLTRLQPTQFTKQGLDSYRRQVVALNRVNSWVRDSLNVKDGEWLAVSRLEAEYARFIPRSMADFSDAIASSALLTSEASEFPLSYAADGRWEASVTMSGKEHPMPKPGTPVSFLYANDSMRDPFKQFKSYKEGEAPVRTRGLLYLDHEISVNTTRAEMGNSGFVSFQNPSVYVVDKLVEGETYNIDPGLMREMGHDGVVVYDNSKSQVVGAIDLGGKKLEFPVGATVRPVQQPGAEAKQKLEADMDSPAPTARGVGL